MTKRIASRKRKRLIFTVTIIAVLLIVYNIWALLYRAREKKTGWVSFPKMQVHFEEINIGKDSGRGNLIGLQPYLIPQYYSTAINFQVNLRFYMNQLKQEGLINSKTIVIFPEYIGSWLVAVHEKENIYEYNTIKSAMSTMAWSNLFHFGYHYLIAPSVKDRATYALFAMKSETMAEIYQQTFSDLAKEFSVTIVAGSIVLRNPSIDTSGKLIVNKGELYNVSAVFGRDGRILGPLVRKKYPIDTELGFTSANKEKNETPLFSTEAGKLGVLICADSWYPDAYKKIERVADMIAIPSLAGTESEWMSPWKGYNGAAAPKDVDTNDFGRISEGDAWTKYSMGKRAIEAGIHNGMNIFFTGNMWDIHCEGRALTLNRDSLQVWGPVRERGRIVNMWLK